jgi:hypothetical protein
MTTRIDLDALKLATPLTLVVQHYLGAPVKSNARGAWWCCPFHTEKSASFLVGGRSDRAQEYHCFGCGAHGDALEFIKAQEHLGDAGRDFVAACEKLAALAGQSLPTADGPAQRAVAPVVVQPPTGAWQDAAQRFIAESQAALWGSFGTGCLRYLREHRGLTDETIRAFGLGWNNITRKDAQTLWGIPDREKPVWLPQGLVIPGTALKTLWYVKIRPSADVRRYFQAKYYQIPSPDEAARTALLGLDTWQTGLPLLLCEGELDCLTVWQEARGLVNAATLGGASKGRAGEKLNFGRWLPYLGGYARILVAYDPDTAGQTAQDAFGRVSARFAPVRVPFGEDINDFHVNGGDVAGWLTDLTGFPKPVRSVPPDWPKTLIFPDRPGVPFINGQWRRLDDGRIEATFMDAEELQIVLDAAQAIAAYGNQ